MRLIDADKVIVSDDDCFGKCRDCKNNITNCSNLVDLINDEPTVDAVEVIRCRECTHADTKRCPLYMAGWGYTDDDFCSCGERGESDA